MMKVYDKILIILGVLVLGCYIVFTIIYTSFNDREPPYLTKKVKDIAQEGALNAPNDKFIIAYINHNEDKLVVKFPNKYNVVCQREMEFSKYHYSVMSRRNTWNKLNSWNSFAPYNLVEYVSIKSCKSSQEIPLVFKFKTQKDLFENLENIWSINSLYGSERDDPYNYNLYFQGNYVVLINDEKEVKLLNSKGLNLKKIEKSNLNSVVKNVLDLRYGKKLSVDPNIKYKTVDNEDFNIIKFEYRLKDNIFFSALVNSKPQHLKYSISQNKFYKINVSSNIEPEEMFNNWVKGEKDIFILK